MRTALPGVLEFFDHQRGRAFAHHKSIALEIERPARFRWIPGELAHRLDNGESAEREGAERSFCAPGDDDIREAIPDVTERLTDRYRAAGTTVGIGRADAAEAEFDCNV